MKAQTKNLAALLIIVVSLFIVSCQTFMPDNILDDAQKIKSWINDCGYLPKDNGYDIYMRDNADLTKTYVKAYNFGKADDKIVGGSQLVNRIKPINNNVRYECTVDISNDYYLIRVWKSYLITDFSENSTMTIEKWKSPFISEVYLRIPETGKSDFTNAVNRLESDFSMDYAQFMEYHEQMLIKMQLEEQEDKTEQDSVQTGSF